MCFCSLAVALFKAALDIPTLSGLAISAAKTLEEVSNTAASIAPLSARLSVKKWFSRITSYLEIKMIDL
jgi:hypothetical protein